jgi:hypothetical protein
MAGWQSSRNPDLPQVFEHWQIGTSVQLRIKGYVPSRKYQYMSPMPKGKTQGVPGPAGAVSSWLFQPVD